MSKSMILGFALTVVGAALSFAGPVSAQTGAYTDPSPYVRQSLQREHMVLSHPDAVQRQTAANRKTNAGREAGLSYASAAPSYVIRKDLSILSQH